MLLSHAAAVRSPGHVTLFWGMQLFAMQQVHWGEGGEPGLPHRALHSAKARLVTAHSVGDRTYAAHLPRKPRYNAAARPCHAPAIVFHAATLYLKLIFNYCCRLRY